jgi:hypothetical protein
MARHRSRPTPSDRSRSGVTLLAARRALIFTVVLVAATVLMAAAAGALAPRAAAAVVKPPIFESVVAGIGAHSDAATGLAVGADGSLYGCGSLWGAATGSDITVTRFDDAPLGWTRTWNGPADTDDQAVDVAVAEDGSVYVYGSEGSGPDAKPVLIKYSAAGALLWAAREAVHPWGYAGRIALDGAGNVVACSMEDNEDSGGRRVVLTKYRPDGTVAWSRMHSVFTYKPEMAATDLFVTGTGVTYVAGGVVGPDIGRRAFLVSFSAGGQERWSRVYGGPGCGGAWFMALAPCPEGGVYAVGSARSDADDILVTRYTAGGTRVLTRRLGVGDGHRQWAADAAVDSQGRLAVCGAWRSSDKGFYVALLRRDGAVKWSHNYRGDKYGGFAKALVVDAADRVCVTGNGPGTDILHPVDNGGGIVTYAFSRAGALRWWYSWPVSPTALAGRIPYDIAALQASNVWVCGSSDQGPATGPDQFVIGWAL